MCILEAIGQPMLLKPPVANFNHMQPPSTDCKIRNALYGRRSLRFRGGSVAHGLTRTSFDSSAALEFLDMIATFHLLTIALQGRCRQHVVLRLSRSRLRTTECGIGVGRIHDVFIPKADRPVCNLIVALGQLNGRCFWFWLWLRRALRHYRD